VNKAIFLSLMTLMLIIVGGTTGEAEVIYTKDGEQIQAKIDVIDDGVVWYEVTLSEDVTEYLGIDLADVEKIENDDGTAYTEPQSEEEQE